MLNATSRVGADWRSHLPSSVTDLPAVPIAFVRDVTSASSSMSEEMAGLAQRIDKLFGWTLTSSCSREVLLQHAACQAAILLHDRHCDEGKSELLQTKLFCLVMMDLYRCHAEPFFTHNNGAWVLPSVSCRVSRWRWMHLPAKV